MTTEHSEARHRFEESLDEVRTGILELGGLVLENARRAGEALLDNRLDLARIVVGADEEIDHRYSRLEFRVFEIMARQQPVAGDLRFLVASTRILYEIERSGDLAVNVAKGLLRRDGYTMPPAIHALVHCAAVYLSRRTTTPDGFETMFATNVLGPFLLTDLLLPAITAGSGRVSVTTVIRGPNGAVRLSALRPNFVASSAKMVRSAATIILRCAAMISAL